MAAISYLYRRGARYHYRRRLYLRAVFSRPISVAMGTSDPGEARRLAARLSVRWEATMTAAAEQVVRGYMTGAEAVAVFRQGLDDELGRATAGLGVPDPEDARAARLFEASYRLAEHLDPDAVTCDADLLAACTPGFSDRDRRALKLLMQVTAPQPTARRAAGQALAAAGAPVNAATLRDARTQVLRGRAEAQARAALAFHPDVASRGDGLTCLLDDDFVAALRAGIERAAVPASSPAEAPASAPDAASPYLAQDKRRFSEVVDQVIAAIQKAGDWNEDIGQRRRIVWAFAWITGDKRPCDYRPADAELFARALSRLPTSFRWGTPGTGAMSRPFAEVIEELPPLRAGEERSARTLNRDLTTMSRVARELAKVAWRPKLGGAPVMSFTDFGAGVRDDIGDPDRMPWTEKNLRAAFSSPIYLGGGGCGKRFKAVPGGEIFQDAAYWVPLLMAYCILAREETCSLECEDFVFDVDTPYVIIRANMTRSKDGARPSGLKRAARLRMIPLHPELLRLGIRNYVERLAMDGHSMLFPELYQEEHEKRGGVRFYACCGRYLLDYVDSVEPLLRTRRNKRADLHSMRTAGASALEDSDARAISVQSGS